MGKIKILYAQNREKKENNNTAYKTVKKNIAQEKTNKQLNTSTPIKNSEFSLAKIDLRKAVKKGSFYIDKKIALRWGAVLKIALTG